MTCRRAFEADLPAVLHGESADADFLAHYPTCPACATEVGVWRELDGMLRTRTPDVERHPEPETLVAFADAAATLGGDVRAEVERHLASCRLCADELKALAGFDPARLGAPVPIAPAPRPERSALARIVWHPAFAYALVAVLLVPIVLERWPQMETRFAEDKAPAEPESALLAERDGSARPVAPPPPAAPAAQAAPPAQPRRESAPKEKAARYADPTEEELVRSRESRQISKMGRALADADAPRDTGAVARAPRMKAPLAGAAPAGGVAENAAPRALAETVVPERVLDIRADAPNVFEAPPRDAVVRLRVAAPPALGAGPVTVTVHARAGGALVLTWHADRADAIAIDIPPNRLLPGEYAVGLSPVPEAASGTSQSAMEIRFTVRTPSSAVSEP